MNLHLVMTTINNPTEVVPEFARTGVFDQITVVGDRKTPSGWESPGVNFLPAADHASVSPELASELRWNHYSRKMIGYLHAIKSGATMIYDTDDDNYPEPWFSAPVGPPTEVNVVEGDQGFVNVYREFSDEHIWPRGLPLRLITNHSGFSPRRKTLHNEPAIIQGLANGSPDVDAIYRLVGLSEEVTFQRRLPVLLRPGTVSPLNSQNTWFSRAVFPLLYLPSTVTFRFTDILRGIIAQPICWKFGHKVLFTEANVRQVRNPHDPMKDFVDEIPMFLQVEEVLGLARASAQSAKTVSSALVSTYQSLERAKIVEEGEVALLMTWIAELESS